MIADTRSSELRFSWSIRRLHMLIASFVTIQIVIGLTMTAHTPTLFLSHQIIGLTIAAIVLAHWIWLLIAEPEQLSNLYPLTSEKWQAIRSDITALRRGVPPSSGPGPGLPALVHGLGLLSLTAVATFGTAIFVIIHWGNIRTATAHTIVDLHVFFAWLLIIYWVGHVSLAITHETKGDRIMARIFSLKR